MWTHVRTHPEVVVGEPTEPDFEGALAQLTQSFVTGRIPLQYIENKELVAAFQLVAPGFVLPSRKTLRNRDLPQLQDAVRVRMCAMMETIQAFALTVDSWTSMTTQQFIGVTAHGITAEWTLESFMLDLIPVEEAETSEYIAERVSKTLKEWGINHQAITSITTDGANNIQTAVTKHLNLPWVWCLAHRLHLIVIKGNSSLLPPPPPTPKKSLTMQNANQYILALALSKITPLVTKATAIARYFKRSASARRILTVHQNLNGVKPFPLKLNTKTRWGSALDMFSRLKKVTSFPLVGCKLLLLMS